MRLSTRLAAWVVAVLKAHGVDPHWRKGSYKDLSAECQQRFRDVNLHWHDLRHEYASGWSSEVAAAQRRSMPLEYDRRRKPRYGLALPHDAGVV